MRFISRFITCILYKTVRDATSSSSSSSTSSVKKPNFLFLAHTRAHTYHMYTATCLIQLRWVFGKLLNCSTFVTVQSRKASIASTDVPSPFANTSVRISFTNTSSSIYIAQLDSVYTVNLHASFSRSFRAPAVALLCFVAPLNSSSHRASPMRLVFLYSITIPRDNAVHRSFFLLDACTRETTHNLNLEG